MQRHASRGGGKRHGVCVACLFDDFAARQLRSQATKVGRYSEIADEWLTRGARNEIHICDSNMNGSSEREAISRRYADNETGLDAKMPRGIEAKSVTGITESILAPMVGERICGRTECNESGKRADGANCDRVTIAELCERKANPRQESSSLRTVVSIRNVGAGENQNEIIQSYPSPAFVPLAEVREQLLPTPRWGEGNFTKTTQDNSCNARHSERQRRNPAYYYNPSKLQGENMNNLIKNNNTSISNIGGVGTPFYVDKLASDVGLVNPTYFAVYPSKSSLTREDLSFGKIVHYNNFNLTETVHSPFTTHNSLKEAAFTLAEVLITLGIIGVVAALTISNLIAKFQQKEGVVALKKEISVLNQAAAKVVVDFGSVPDCYMWLQSPYSVMNKCIKKDNKGACIQWGDDDGNPRPSDYLGRSTECSSYNKVLLQNLKIIKTCNESYYDGCTVAYKGFEDVLKEKNDKLTDDELYIQTQGRANLRAKRIKELPAIVLADGSIIIQYTYPKEIIIDVNGKRGPNKWGYDLFYVVLYGAPDKGLFYKPAASLVEKGGLKDLDALLK